MKAKSFLTLLFSILFTSLFAQTFEKPYVESVGDRICYITEVELTKQYTVIKFEHLNNSSWIRLSKNMFIKTSDDKRYKYIKSEGIAIDPDQYDFKEGEEKHSFKVYFQPLPKNVKVFDVIEVEPGSRNDFNFYGVDLTRKRESDKQKSHFVDDEVAVDSVQSSSPLDFSNGFGNMFKDIYKSSIDAYFNYLKEPGKLKELAKLNKEFFDALISEGFTKEQAMQILTATPLIPNGAGGKK